MDAFLNICGAFTMIVITLWYCVMATWFTDYLPSGDWKFVHKRAMAWRYSP